MIFYFSFPLPTPKIPQNWELLALDFPFIPCLPVLCPLCLPNTCLRVFLPLYLSQCKSSFLFPYRCCSFWKDIHLFPISGGDWMIFSSPSVFTEPVWYQPRDWNSRLAPHPRISREFEPYTCTQKKDKVAWLRLWYHTIALTTLQPEWCQNKI